MSSHDPDCQEGETCTCQCAWFNDARDYWTRYFGQDRGTRLARRELLTLMDPRNDRAQAEGGADE